MTAMPSAASLAKRATVLALAATAVLGPSLARAIEEQGGIPTMIVTVERREANLQTVPVAVSAFNAQALENREINDYQDLQSVVPSLKMTNNITSPTNLSPSLRGSLQQDASLIVAESPFGIYIDDVYVARMNGNNLALNDIERVEVLRGPQGTLYGRNTLQGALKFISRTPGDDSWLNASLGGGNYDQWLASASAGGPFGEDWAGSIAGLYTNKKGEWDNVVTNADVDHEQNYAVRGKVRYRGIEKLDVVLSASYVDSKNDSLPLVNATTPGVPDYNQYTSDDLVPTYGYYNVATPTQSPPAPPPITANPEGKTKQTIASLNASYDFDLFTLRSITGFVKTEDFFSTDFSGVGTIIGAADTDVDQWTEELQAYGTALDDRLSFIGGLYWFHESGDQDFGWYFLLPLSTSQIHATTDSYAAYAQVDYKITEALKATVGLRYTRDEKDFDIDQQITPTGQAVFGGSGLLACNDPAEAFPCATSGPLSSVSRDNTYNETTPRFGLDYTFEPFGDIDSMMVYVSAAKGFKSGGYNGIAIFNLRDAQQTYAPEKNWTYETGIKLDAMDNRIRLNMDYFYADISDLTANATVGFSFPVANVGDAKVHGIELDLTMVPVENLTVFWNAAFEHGEYSSLNPEAAPAQAAYKYQVHPRVPQTPSYAFTLGFDYGVPLPFGDFGGKFRFGMDYFRTDEYVTAATNDFMASDYDRVNGYIGLDFLDNWNVTLSAKNIADHANITSGSRSTTLERQPDGTIVVSPGGLGGFITMPPREVMLTVNYKM